MSLATKLVQVYNKVDHVEKAGHNKNQNYDFVRAADVVRAIRAALSELGVYAEVIFTNERQYTIPREKAPNAPFAAVDVRCDITFHDSETGETLHASGLGTGADTGDKAIYKAMTGSLKYCLRSAFLVPDEADPEADESVDRAAEAPTSFEDVRDSRPAPRPSPPKTAPATTSSVTPKVSSPAPTAATPSTPPTSNAPAADKSTSQQFPTEKELEAYRAQFKKLGDDLALAGLKSSKGLPINMKTKVFMLQVAGVNDPKDMSVEQWETFFTLASQTQTADLVAAINLANGVETK